MEFRHELKHEICYAELLEIRQRLHVIAKPDIYAVDGRYMVRSLYFDNAADKALREKIDGVNMREKFRIRYYNHDPSWIVLEKKIKRGELGSKQSCPLTYEEAEALAMGEYQWMRDDSRELVYELYQKIYSQGLRAKTIVDYTREPFVYDAGNVRVTLDYDIRTGLHNTDFLNTDCITIPIRDMPMILEVKWDCFLPSVIRDAVMLKGQRTTSFSKYAACRMYD